MTQTLEVRPDWGDVVRRARRAARARRALEAAAVLAVVIVGVASAYALGHPVVDFGTAKHAGVHEVDEFGSMQVAAPRGMAPGVLPHQTRRITSVRIDGKVHTLYVAPTKHGGFCYEWTQLGGTCRASRHSRYATHIDPGGLIGRNGLIVLEGSFIQAAGDRLTMTFKDGATAEVPFVFVSTPISAGFYLYRVPDAHRRAATRPTSLALYNKAGKLLDREPIIGGESPLATQRPHKLAGFGVISAPAAGIWAKRVLLFDLRAPGGQRVGLWSMPMRGGGRCYATNTGSGCFTPALLKTMPPLEVGFNGDRLCCSVSTRIVRVEALFQDGARVELQPRAGFLVWPIPTDHWALGHRITTLVGYDAAGRVITREKLAAPKDQRGIYPCKKPKNLGYGVKECV